MNPMNHKNSLSKTFNKNDLPMGNPNVNQEVIKKHTPNRISEGSMFFINLLIL